MVNGYFALYHNVLYLYITYKLSARLQIIYSAFTLLPIIYSVFTL